MHVSVLSSGSKGNATYIELDGTRLLIDAGISARRIDMALRELGTSAQALDGVLLTHEHADHVKGLEMLLKKYRLPLFSRQGTLACLKGDFSHACIHPIEESLEVGGVRIDCFNIPHDAADPVGFRLSGSERCTVATDLGFVTSSVQEAIDGSDVLILEANHDTKLLKQGRYPWPLKQRVLSNRGHLSNDDAGWALARLRKKPRSTILAHLSEENNIPAVARESVETILARAGIENIELTLAKQDAVVTVS
ncbi:MBL fold metallo-hydrolase [Selenomonas sp. TAMA-11512]|uniref:MBL fold metallo-hydrolase n=1 Tax=Selenomonas sp. TAMA-11512 TaxID=3095337 RepID=UPI00308E7A10|nr:MBL fold metallo-hydrolase [Selenomonas sp. TAMA-11512]